MRRLFRITLYLFLALIALALASPWWLPLPLRPLLKRNGVTYATFETNGYTRLIITGLNITTPAADITAGRVEADTPVVLLWRRLVSKPGPVAIDDLAVTIKPTPPGATAPAPGDNTDPTGLQPIRERVNGILAQASPWLPELRITKGTVNIDADNTIRMDRLDLKTNAPIDTATAATLTLSGVDYKNHRADLALTWGDSIDIALNHTTGAPSDAATSTLAANLDAGNNLDATLSAFGQTVTLAARFPRSGWLPETALIDAPRLALTPAQLARLKLPADITAATGAARLEYKDARLTADITARADSEKTPLDLALRAAGAPGQIDITALDLAIPGLTAKLTAPVTITRDLRLLTPRSRFTLDADLAAQPWLAGATGRVTGEITLATAQLDKLDGVASLRAENISVHGIAIKTLSLEATQQDRLTTLDKLDLALPAGTRLTAAGRYDTAARALAKTTLDARLHPADLAPWLPEGITFEEATLTLDAEGPDTAPAHTGALALKKLRAPGLANPADITADWRGRALAAHTLNLALSAAATELRLSAENITPDRATLTALSLAKDGAHRLALASPATFALAPGNTLSLTPLALASPNNVSKISIQSAGALPSRTPNARLPPLNFSLIAANIDSALFADLIDTGPLPWSIAAAEVTASLATPDAPLDATLTLDARLDYARALDAVPEPLRIALPESASINIDAALTPKNLEIRHLTISETIGRSLIAHISGEIPLVITPAAGTPLVLDKNAPLTLDAHTQPDSPFWQNLATATGITLVTPAINARVAGTLANPSATAGISIAAISLDQARWPKHFPKLPDLPPLPPVTDLAIKLNSDGDTLNLETLSLRVAGQPLNATAVLALPSSTPNPEHETPDSKLHPLSFTLDATADLAAFSEYAHAILAPRGHLRLEASLAPGGPIAGRLRLNDAALRPLAPLGVVSAINIDARLTGRRLEITTATARIGNQPAALAGTLDLPDLLAGESALSSVPDLTIKASNIPLVREPGMLVRTDINLRIHKPDTAAAAPTIGGRLTLRDSLFLADLRALWSTRPASGPASRPPFFAIETPPLDKWRLDLDIRGRRFLNIDTTVFAGNLSASFKLDGTLGNPRLVGDATIDSGRVLLPFATFTTETGRVRLSKSNPHLPVIEFTATTRNLGYDLRMEISGDTDNPRLTFTSSPALTSEQILLFVMAGESPTSETDTSGQQRAISLGAYLGQGFINELFGLSPGESRLSITSGERRTRQGRETYSVEYTLSDRWKTIGEYDEFDAYNAGLKWRVYTGKLHTNRSRVPRADGVVPDAAPSAVKNKPPKIKISGDGWWSGLRHKRMLQRTLSLDKTHAPALNANEIEDAAFLLVSQLVSKGYLHPQLTLTATPPAGGGAHASRAGDVAPDAGTARVSRADGVVPDAAPQTFTTDSDFVPAIPIDLAAQKLAIKIAPGIRYRLRDVTITGARAIPPDEARYFFLPADSLFGGKSIPYSPAALGSAVSSLQEALRQRGHARATVAVEHTHIDDATGRVTADITVNEGPLWQIATLSAETRDAAPPPLELTAALHDAFLNKPWSQWLQQDIAEHVRQYYYKHGYPDITAQVTAEPVKTFAAHTAAGTARVSRADSVVPDAGTARVSRADSVVPDAAAITPLDVRVAITPGPQVRIAEITLRGNRHTRESLIRRRLRAHSGELLDPLALEASRNRIGNLGVFRTANITYAPPGETRRDVNIRLLENPTTDISLLLGWGSYEQLRGGVELRRLNILGIADQTRVQVVQSTKSTNGEITFSLPDLFARNVNGSIRAFGLRREEKAFDREEYGGTVTLRRGWPRRGYETSAGYTYESLNNTGDILSPDAGDSGRTIAAAINLSLSRDRRDNPLNAKRGYNWYLQGEFASHYLGGRANYQRYRGGIGYHTSWGRTRWIHAGLSQGLIRPIGSKDTPLPINKLFYTGGENSIRGYQEGDASPRDENGAYLGAKVYTLLNVEVEQALIGGLTLVVFYDLLGQSATMTDYPGNEWLNSIGLGVRYHTILGPLRLEYGHNLNPRAGDPKGTLQFSIGMPF